MDKKKWYVHHNGKAAGPFSSAKLKQLAAHGRIGVNTQVRLGEGTAWVTASRVKGLFPDGPSSPQDSLKRKPNEVKKETSGESPKSTDPPRRISRPADARDLKFDPKLMSRLAARSPTNPYLPPAGMERDHAKGRSQANQATGSRVGLNRWAWVLAAVGLEVVTTFGAFALVMGTGLASTSFLAPLLFGYVGQMLLASQRLRNIGNSPWWSGMSLIPAANGILKAYCLIAPPNYAHTKKLDTPRMILTGLLIAGVVGTFAMLMIEAL